MPPVTLSFAHLSRHTQVENVGQKKLYRGGQLRGAILRAGTARKVWKAQSREPEARSQTRDVQRGLADRLSPTAQRLLSYFRFQRVPAAESSSNTPRAARS